MSSMTSLKTIKVSRTLFARYGIPEELVSDNELQLASEEFTQLMKQNVFRSSRVPLYHRASNGAAGRSVQTSKAVLTKQVLNGKANTLSLKHRLVLKLSQGNLPLNCVWNDRLGTETQPQQSSRGATVEAERAPG